MVLSNKMRTTISCLLLSCFLCLAACEDWAKRLEFGQSIPDARLEIRLNEPTSKYGLYQRFEQAAHRGGFFHRRGRHLSAEDIRQNNLPPSHKWYPSESSDRSEYHVSFYWPRRVERPWSFVFVFYNSSLNAFTAKEWRMFYEWKDEHLPIVFPEALIEITKHPAQRTARENLSEISNVTGIPIPEKYMKYVTDSP